MSADEVCHFHIPPVARYLIPMQILRSLCHCCKIQSSLSRDEIALLYKRARTSTDCLIDYDIIDYCQVQSPATDNSAFGSVAHARSPEPACIGNILCFWRTRIAVAYSALFLDPSLITMNMNARDHNMTPFVSTPDPSHFQTPTLSNAEGMLSQPASPPRGNIQDSTEIGLLTFEQRLTFENRNSPRTPCQSVSRHATRWLSL